MSPYVLLLIATLLIDFAGNLPVGALPLALQRDGVSTGAIATAVGAGLVVPIFGSVPVGAMVDRIGRLPSIRIAVVLVMISLFGMAWLHGAVWAAVLLGLRSFAFMTYMTAEFAYVTHIVRRDRAVSAASTLGMIGNLSFAVAPAATVYLWMHGAGRGQFVWGTALAAAGGLVLLLLPAKHDMKTRRSRHIFMRSAWLPAMGFVVAATLQSGVNSALAVITFHERGIVNGALIFTAMAFTTFALRYPSSKFVERYGARIVAIPVALLQMTGCVLASQAHSVITVVVAGLFLGMAWSAMVPVAIVLFFERSSPRSRGIAMGAYNLAFSIGAAAGALLAALTSALGYGYAWAIVLCALGPAIAVPFVFTGRPPQRALSKAPA